MALSQARNHWVARKPRLRVQADGRIDGAKSLISAPLHDFEKEQILETPGIELQVFAALVLVVEDVVRLQQFQPRGIEIDARFEIVVVVLRNRQGLDAVGFQPRRRTEDVTCRKRDVLNPRTEILVEES